MIEAKDTLRGKSPKTGNGRAKLQSASTGPLALPSTYTFSETVLFSATIRPMGCGHFLLGWVAIGVLLSRRSVNERLGPSLPSPKNT